MSESALLAVLAMVLFALVVALLMALRAVGAMADRLVALADADAAKSLSVLRHARAAEAAAKGDAPPPRMDDATSFTGPPLFSVEHGGDLP